MVFDCSSWTSCITHLNLLPQGQTIKHVGVFLGTYSFFSHGQLYVALSRTTSPRHLKIYKSKEEKTTTGEATMMNVVFKEVLVCKCIKCSIPKDQLRYWYPLIDSGYFITFILMKSYNEMPDYVAVKWLLYQTRLNHWISL